MSDRYLSLLGSLLPKGVAWARQPGSYLLKLLEALSLELARADTRAQDLMAEQDPRTTTELLSEWERLLGMPTECLPLANTDTLRRIDIYTRLNILGGQTKQYFIDMAALAGFDIDVLEYNDIDTGDPGSILDPGQIFHWVVVAESVPITYFRAGQSRAGDRLRDWGAQRLECVINEIKPMHTVVHFSYSE